MALSNQCPSNVGGLPLVASATLLWIQLTQQGRMYKNGVGTIGATLVDLRALVVSLQEEINALKSNRVDPAQTPAIDFEEIVQEVNDRQSRKNNLIIYGIVESTDQSNTRRKVYDADQVKNIIGVLDDEVNTDNIKPIRLGSNNTGGPRPIKITLRDSNDVRSCIKAAAKLKRHSTFSRINISFDRTPRQVLHYKKLKQEVADRSVNGENGLKIKYVNGVPKVVAEN
nr:unnamed protein product [Callosobruchus analis]